MDEWANAILRGSYLEIVYLRPWSTVPATLKQTAALFAFIDSREKERVLLSSMGADFNFNLKMIFVQLEGTVVILGGVFHTPLPHVGESQVPGFCTLDNRDLPYPHSCLLKTFLFLFLFFLSSISSSQQSSSISIHSSNRNPAVSLDPRFPTWI